MPRALHLTETTNTVDGNGRPNPPYLWNGSIPDLFAQMLKIIGGDGTILVHPSAARLLRLPCEQMPTGEDARKHPVAELLRAAGWKIPDVHRWFHVKHPDHGTAHVGLTGFFDGGHFPLIDTPAAMTSALAQWHDITGHAWTGGAGDAGNEILRSIRYGKGRTPQRPEWWSWAGPTLPALERGGPPRYPAETWYTPSQWRRPVGPEVTQISSLDRVRAYLGALTCTKVAARPLEHTPGKLIFDGGLCGWWLVRCEPWEFPDLLPDPAGYPSRGDGDATGVRWLTSPRVALLEELARRGEYRYEILDSWTAPATDVVKQLGTELRKAWQATKLIQDPAVQRLVRAGVKEAYRQFPGHWRSSQSSVQRPDFSGALIATNATNTWRRAYELGRNGGDWEGPWPVQIDTDSLYYPGAKADVQDYAAVAGWTVHDSDRQDLDDVTELGQWRTGRTLEYDPAAGHPVRKAVAA